MWDKKKKIDGFSNVATSEYNMLMRIDLYRSILAERQHDLNFQSILSNIGKLKKLYFTAI